MNFGMNMWAMEPVNNSYKIFIAILKVGKKKIGSIFARRKLGAVVSVLIVIAKNITATI
jgi:6-phosphogluconate dehydrogenase